MMNFREGVWICEDRQKFCSCWIFPLMRYEYQELLAAKVEVIVEVIILFYIFFFIPNLSERMNVGTSRRDEEMA